jgi:hypothetical protein
LQFSASYQSLAVASRAEACEIFPAATLRRCRAPARVCTAQM